MKETAQLHLTPIEINSKGRFYNAVGGTQSPYRTFVSLKFEPPFLTVNFRCEDEPFMNQTKLSKDNAPLWQQSVFEVFISAGKEISSHYLELEINPNNAVFMATVFNPDGSGANNHLTMLDRDTLSLTSHVDRKINNWAGFLRFDLIKFFRTLGVAPSTFLRMNFFRLALKKSQEKHDWKNTPEISAYTCWQSPCNKTHPKFHHPHTMELFKVLL